MRASVRTLAVALALILLASLAPPLGAAEGWSAVGIQVRQGRRPAPGIEVRLRPDGPTLADPGELVGGVTDEQGRAVIYLQPGVWRLELLSGDEVAYFVSVRVTPGRRAEEVGSPARDVDAPDLRWRYFAVDEPPPVELIDPVRPPRMPESPAAATPSPMPEERAVEAAPQPSPAAPPTAPEPVAPAAEVPPVEIPAEEAPSVAPEPTPGDAEPSMPPAEATAVEAPSSDPTAAESPAVEVPAVVPPQVEVPERPAVEEPAWEEPAPVESAPLEPTPVEPTPVEPTQVEPTPIAPAPIAPAPVEPAQVEPAPVPDPVPVEPPAVDPTPSDSSPFDSIPRQPSPYDPPPAAPLPAPEVEPVAAPAPSAGNEEPPAGTAVPAVPPTTVVESPAPPAATPPEAPPAPQPTLAPPADLPPVDQPATTPVPEREPSPSQPTPAPDRQMPTLPEPLPAPAAPAQPPVVAPAVPPVPPPAAEPELPSAPPRFAAAAAGECPDCRADEAVAVVERTVVPGGGACGGEIAAAALSAGRGLAGRATGPQALEGGALASWTGGTGCQLLGVVLPAGAVYRGYRYEVEGGSGAGRCYAGSECPVADAVWPQRPTIHQLDDGATVVYGLFRNASEDRSRRARLTVYYLP